MNWNQEEKEILERNRVEMDENPAKWLISHISSPGEDDYLSIVKIGLALCLLRDWPIYIVYSKRSFGVNLGFYVISVEGENYLKDVYTIDFSRYCKKIEINSPRFFAVIKSNLEAYLGISSGKMEEISKQFKLRHRV